MTQAARFGDLAWPDELPASLPATENAAPNPIIPAGIDLNTGGLTLGNTGVTINAPNTNQQSSNISTINNTNVVNTQYAPKRIVPFNFDMTGGASLILVQQGTVFEFNYGAASTSFIRVRFDAPDAPVIKFLLGQSIAGVPFRALYIDWDTDANAVGGQLAQVIVTLDTPFDRVSPQG